MNRLRSDARFAEKDCEQCSARFHRKPGRTDAWWAKARFCSRDCWIAHEKGKGRKGSSGRVKECEFFLCSRTFWQIGNQSYCRDPECRDQRNREHARAYVKRHGTAEDVEKLADRLKQQELDRLIGEQHWDARWGNSFFSGTKSSGSVISLEALVSPTNYAQFDWDDHLERDENEPFPVAKKKRRAHSNVPGPTPRKKAA